MSVKWTASHSDSGILRKSEFKEKKEDLFVFGYSCKLFRDNEKALHIDQGKHLIPWMGDETLKIDRYDARGALHDLSTLEAPPGGYDWRIELTRNELEVEQLCDEERYRALHTDEDEEEMYKEEELKRLHAAGYGQVGFNYESTAEPAQPPQLVEVDEPFVPTPTFRALLPADMVLPESMKQNAIIEKTAKFIALQGVQMEILIKTKQGDNPQFKFLNKDSVLHPYYTALIALVKAEKWPEKKVEVIEEKHEPEEYLHPSLATVIESAPSIPSIHYKPSADCDYTMLISKMRGEATLDEAYTPELAPGEVAPPGTEPLPPRSNAEISRAPVMYNRAGDENNHEEELKRLHAAGYGQVGFNYESTAEPAQPPQPVEVDEPFVPTPTFRALLPADMVLPESMKQNAIIEKTAKFIALQGVQMEILIKTKQGDNPQFKFLNKDSVLHPYYTALIALVKAEKWPEKKVEVIEEKHEPEEYLHPSLATVIESAPSIPSIHYKPSADCDYTMLISKMRGEATLDEAYTPELAPGEVAPPGTEPLPPRSNAEISRAPVMYNRAGDENHHVTSTPANLQMSQEQYRQQYAAYYQQYMAAHAPPDPKKETPPAPLKSTGLSLMKNYDTDSDSDVSDFDDTSSTDSKEPAIVKPPEDVQLVIDKMAAYVARNGDEFAEIVRSKNDPRFTFLEPDNVYHPYYKRLMQEKRGIDVNGKSREGKQNKSSAPVSFSIKKLKEPDPILPKPALPYESSSDDDSEQQTDKVEEPKDVPKSVPQVSPIVIPPPVVYKIEPTQINEVQLVAPIETVTTVPKPEPIVVPEVKEIPNETKQEEKPVPTELVNNTSKEIDEVKKEPRPPEEKKEEKKEEKYKERERASPRREKKKHRDKDKDRKKEYHSKSTSREETKDKRVDRRSVEKEKKREREREKEREIDKEKKRQRISKEELENEIISLEDNSDDLIDLTGDQSDTKADCETEGERAKQQERRRRAAEFLKKVGVDPAAAALPTSSLASAMVDTLESLRKKKADEEDKRRRREKRRHRDRHGYEDGSDRFHRKSKRRKYKSSDDNEESDYDGSKKKKRKKDKQRSSSRSKRRKSETGIEEEPALNINLTNTLKELRTSSPTKELGLQDVDDMTQHSLRYETSSDEVDDEQETRNAKKKKENREYSEGEWSSDSEQDSASSPPPKND